MMVALPVLEDSSLIFARRVGSMLTSRGHGVFYIHVQERHISRSKLSERQIEESLGQAGLDGSISEAGFMRDDFLANFGAVVVSRSFTEMRTWLKRERFRNRSDRPRFVSFLAGLDFMPRKGVDNRLWFDAVFLNNPADCDLFRRLTQRDDDQIVSWGHPYFVRPKTWRELAPDAPIYMFAQAISPPSLAARLHILHMLHTLARLHPERKIVLKLRHLPNENDNHVHKEIFSYPWLQERYGPPPPPNLHFETGPIGEALAQAGATITCTSTAAMDSISAGVPAFVYLDYVQNYLDPLCRPMRAIFEKSGAIAPLGEILRLNAPAPPPEAWMARSMRDEAALCDALDAAIRGRRPAALDQTVRGAIGEGGGPAGVASLARRITDPV